jgi:hypothetical protein
LPTNNKTSFLAALNEVNGRASLIDKASLISDLDSKVSFKVVQNLSETDTQIALKNLSIIRTKTNNTRGSFRLKSDFDFTFPTGEGEIDYSDSDLEIIHDFDFGGATIIMPNSISLKNSGGIIKNCTIVGDNTKIKETNEQLFENVTFAGNWNARDINLDWFGAKGGNQTNDTNAFKMATQLASLQNKSVINIPSKSADYIFDNTIPLVLTSHTKLHFENADTVIQLTQEGRFINIDTQKGVSIYNGTIKGINGDLGDGANVKISNSENIKIENTTITNASEHGIKVIGTKNSTFKNLTLKFNSKYGAEDRDGTNNKWIDCYCNYNGKSDENTIVTDFGRGITIWRGDRVKIIRSEAIKNSEYGFRIYSENTDVTPSKYCEIKNCYLKDNGGMTKSINIYLYSETSTLIEDCKILNNVIEIEDDTITNTAITIQGTNNVVKGNIIKNISSTENYSVPIFLYNAQNCTIESNRVYNTLSFFGMTATTGQISNNCAFIDNYAETGVLASSFYGDSHKITGGTYKHSKYLVNGVKVDADSSVQGLTVNTNTPNTCIDGVTLIDWYNAIIEGNSNAVIKDTTTINSINKGIFKYGDIIVDLKLGNNIFDSAYPAELIYMESLDTHIVTKRAGAPPTVLHYPPGSICYNLQASVGSIKTWTHLNTQPDNSQNWRASGSVQS